jgi:hypothetical protein
MRHNDAPGPLFRKRHGAEREYSHYLTQSEWNGHRQESAAGPRVLKYFVFHER